MIFVTARRKCGQNLSEVPGVLNFEAKVSCLEISVIHFTITFKDDHFVLRKYVNARDIVVEVPVKKTKLLLM